MPIVPKIKLKTYAHPLDQIAANIPVNKPATDVSITRFFRSFDSNASRNAQIIYSGNKTLYASVSETPAGVLLSKAEFIANNNAPKKPAIMPPNLRAIKNTGITESPIKTKLIEYAESNNVNFLSNIRTIL